MSLDRLLFDVDTALVGVASNAQRLLTVVTIVLPIFIVAFAILAILLVALLIVSIFLQFKRLRVEGSNRRQRNQQQQYEQRLESLIEKLDMPSPPAGIIASPIVFKKEMSPPSPQQKEKQPTFVLPPGGRAVAGKPTAKEHQLMASASAIDAQRKMLPPPPATQMPKTTAIEEEHQKMPSSPAQIQTAPQQHRGWRYARTPLPIPVTVLMSATESSEQMETGQTKKQKKHANDDVDE